jgi:phenylpropionate dioxygenase-like ring-hydroxylating dioxygenase large terminal subunit
MGALMRIRNVETKVFFAQFLARLAAHNLLKDSQILLPKADYERRYGDFPRYFSGWYLFVPSKDLAEGEIVHKKLNGLDLVAYRDKEGKPVIHSNRCSHMDGLFAPMATVKDGKIVCAYHRHAYEQGVPQTGPREFRQDPSKCIPCHPIREVNGLVMFWFDADSATGVGEPTWELNLPDVSKFERQAVMRSITPTHMAPLHENIIDDQHFMLLHGTNRYASELLPYHEKHRFRTQNTMTVPAPKIGPFRIGKSDEMVIGMDSDFHGLGIHINTAKIGRFEALMIHCTTPIEDEVTEWTLSIYMPKRVWKLRPDLESFLSMIYPWGTFAQTYYLHTQDRRVFFERGEYRFFEDVPKGHEKVNAFRRWIHEELMGEKRPMGKNSIPTKFVPLVRPDQRRRASA